ncbi:MAG: hypothetical protein RSC98_10790, partial [Clostridia bacterium]
MKNDRPHRKVPCAYPKNEPMRFNPSFRSDATLCSSWVKSFDPHDFLTLGGYFMGMPIIKPGTITRGDAV